METKTKKHFFAPDSQILAMQPVRILDNSLTNYKYGDLDDVPALPSDSGATSKTLILKPLLSTDVQAHEGNVLRGYSVDIIPIYEKVAGNYIYVLDIVNGVLGFYRFVGDKIPPRKVYFFSSQK